MSAGTDTVGEKEEEGEEGEMAGIVEEAEVMAGAGVGDLAPECGGWSRLTVASTRFDLTGKHQR